MSKILFIFLSFFCFSAFGSAKVVSLWEAAEQLKKGDIASSLNYIKRMRDSNCTGVDFLALKRGESEQLIAYLETDCLTDEEKASLVKVYDWKTAVKYLKENKEDLRFTPEEIYLQQRSKLGSVGLALEALLEEKTIAWMYYMGDLNKEEKGYLSMLAAEVGNDLMGVLWSCGGGPSCFGKKYGN